MPKRKTNVAKTLIFSSYYRNKKTADR